MSSELTELSIAIGDIYDASISPARWQKALGSICGFVGGVSATLLWHDATTQLSQALHSFNGDPHSTSLGFEKYSSMSSILLTAPAAQIGTAHAAGDISQNELAPTYSLNEDQNEPQDIAGVLAANIEQDATRSLLMHIHFGQNQRAIDAEARRRFSLVVPHVGRALAIGRLFDQGRPLPRLETLARDHKLTASEVRVFDAVLKASTVKTIAETLGLSQATVKTHLHNLFRKTGTNRRSDLVKLLVGV